MSSGRIKYCGWSIGRPLSLFDAEATLDLLLGTHVMINQSPGIINTQLEYTPKLEILKYITRYSFHTTRCKSKSLRWKTEQRVPWETV